MEDNKLWSYGDFRFGSESYYSRGESLKVIFSLPFFVIYLTKKTGRITSA